MCLTTTKHLFWVLPFLVASCALPGDAAIKVTGTVVDEHGTPYSACVVSQSMGTTSLAIVKYREA